MEPTSAVRGLGEYINEVNKLRTYWEGQGQLRNHEELWFRGEPKDYGETRLTPKLYRGVEHSGRGAQHDEAIKNVLEVDSDNFIEFMRRAAELQHVPSQEGEERWDWYSMMQHYSAPTRLLDWSDGAFMAMHFSIHGFDKPDAPRVFVLNSYLLDKELESHAHADRAHLQWGAYMDAHPKSRATPEDWYDVYLPMSREDREKDKLSLPDCPLLEDPDTVTRRLSAQRSRFMLFRRDPDWLKTRQGDEASWLREIKIDRESVLQIRRELRDAGVTESVIYPDLDGLGREMGHIWEARR